MKIALTQMNIAWEDKMKNRDTCERLTCEASAHSADIIVFPEMTLTGFTMNPEEFGEAECRSETEAFFQTLSCRYNTAVVFGYIEKKGGSFYNMLEMTSGGETLMKYAKIHPFSYGEESRHYDGGDEIVSACYKEAYLGGFICYDLRFPEVFQISSGKNEIIFVIASWPRSRALHWSALLRARAIENQCYMIGVNRTGEGGGLLYQASSEAFDPWGKSIAYVQGEEGFPADRAELLYAEAEAEQARQYRAEFPVRADRRNELYRKLTERGW